VDISGKKIGALHTVVGMMVIAPSIKNLLLNLIYEF
jgi:hypothetical protein